MSILTIKGLSHTYDNKVLFDEADLTVNNGEHIGIVGLNGAGKSTFMKILTGSLVQDAGEVRWLSGIKVGYLDQHADIDRSLTVMNYLEGSFKSLFDLSARLDAAYARMSEPDVGEKELEKLINRTAAMQQQLDEADFYSLEARIKKVAGGLGIGALGYDTLIGKLSGGQRAKVMLAKLLLDEPNVMLLDEPTNFLDLEQIDWLAKYLDAYKGTFLLVSHDGEFLNRVCKIIVNIENSRIKKYWGDYDKFLQQHESDAKQYAESYERQQREIKRMEEYIARNKARAATAGMANSRKKMLERIEVMSKPVSFEKPVFSFPYTLLVTKHLLDVTNKTLMKQLPAISGSFSYNINVKINYIEQDLEFPSKEMNAISFMSFRHPRLSQKEVRNQLAKVGIRGDLSTKAVGALSGGEQVRVKLCSLMQKESNLLILDEPTNHLDSLSKEALAEALEDYAGAFILVSHEPAYADGLCNDIFDLER